MVGVIRPRFRGGEKTFGTGEVRNGSCLGGGKTGTFFLSGEGGRGILEAVFSDVVGDAPVQSGARRLLGDGGGLARIVSSFSSTSPLRRCGTGFLWGDTFRALAPALFKGARAGPLPAAAGLMVPKSQRSSLAGSLLTGMSSSSSSAASLGCLTFQSWYLVMSSCRRAGFPAFLINAVFKRSFAVGRSLGSLRRQR